MSNTDLHYLPITEASRLIRRGELSPVDLVNACLERIEALDDELRAFITVTADSALEEARAAEAEIRKSGWERSPPRDTGVPPRT